MKKITIYLIFLLIIPIILAAVTRNIPNWNCPSGFDVTLTDGGAINSYGAEETLGDWNIVYSSHTYTLKDPDPNDGIKQIAFFGIPPSQQIIYTLVIPAGSYSITGVYALDSSGQKPIGTTNFLVHEDTCIGGTEDDLDSDGYGKGCACLGSDCNDNDNTIHPNAPEIENDGIDQDCDGCDFVDLDDDNYKALGTGCGADDCDDNNALVNPGMPEINCDGIDNDCNNGDCCPSTDENNLSYYDQNCDGKIDDDKKLLFIQNYLAGIIDPSLQLIIDAIPGSGYSNP